MKIFKLFLSWFLIGLIIVLTPMMWVIFYHPYTWIAFFSLYGFYKFSQVW